MIICHLHQTATPSPFPRERALRPSCGESGSREFSLERTDGRTKRELDPTDELPDLIYVLTRNSPLWNFKCGTRSAILVAHASGNPMLFYGLLFLVRVVIINTIRSSIHVCVSARDLIISVENPALLCRELSGKASGLEYQRKRAI